MFLLLVEMVESEDNMKQVKKKKKAELSSHFQ